MVASQSLPAGLAQILVKIRNIPFFQNQTSRHTIFAIMESSTSPISANTY